MMRSPLRLLVLAVAFATAGQPALAAGSQGTYFRAVGRSQTRAFLLNEQGDSVYSHERAASLTRLARLRTAAGQPWTWATMPLGLASFRGDFLVVNGTNVLERFSGDGLHKKRVTLPVRATAITSTAESVWLYSALPSVQGARFWRATNGEDFKAANVAFTADGDARSRVLDLQITFAVDADGTLYFARSIGEPVVHKRMVDGKDERVTVAYSRSRERSRATRYVEGRNDLTTYSAPVADLFIDARGRLIVTRNREDAARRDGGREVWLRRRVDIYDQRGRHIATATFPDTIRTVLQIDDTAVIAATNDGRVVRTRLDAPQPGGISD